MAQHMLCQPELGFIDKRRLRSNDADSHLVGVTVFTSNATGTTTTAKGADATLATGVNVIRVGEKLKAFTSAGVLYEETILTVTSVSSAAGTTTVTFTPALAAAPVSGDLLKKVGNVLAYESNDSLDDRLNAYNSTTYSTTNLDKMTQNDKIYALRLIDDPGSL